MFSGIFIDRPNLAIVLSLVMAIAGLLALGIIPVSQFPQITPPAESRTAGRMWSVGR
jgi:HAE1 family hydrophobic/amphiphilic exporter-1